MQYEENCNLRNYTDTVVVRIFFIQKFMGNGVFQATNRFSEEEKEKLIAENDRLRRTLEISESDYYIEKIARDELHLTKAGETLILVDDEAIPNILGIEDEVVWEEQSNWEKWVEVLFGGE